jgi:hypothetical protein
MSTPAVAPLPPTVPWVAVLRWFVVVLLAVLLLQTLGSALQLPAQRGSGYPASTQLFQLGGVLDGQGLLPRWVAHDRAAVLAFWQASGGMRFIASAWFLVDALVLVPAYLALLLALQRLWVALLPAPAPARALRALRLSPWLGAGFDQLENALSLIAIHRAQPAPGPVLEGLLSASTGLKWLALAVALLASGWCGWRWLRCLGWRRVGDGLLALARLIANSAQVVALHAYAFFALAAGVLLVGHVPQVQDILVALAQETADDRAGEFLHYQNLQWLLYGVVLWGASIWYSMRLVAPWTPQGPERDNGWHLWARRDLPRLAAYFGVVAVATLCALSMAGRATLANALFMGLGAAIMFEAVSSTCSWCGNRLRLFRPGYHSDGGQYRVSALALSTVAALVAWRSVDQHSADLLGGLGWTLPPAGVWQWQAARVESLALPLFALFAGAVLAYALVTLVRRGPLWHGLLNAVGLACWWTAAALTDGHYAVAYFGFTLLLAAAGLWLLAERRQFNLPLFRFLYRLFINRLPQAYQLFARQPQLVLGSLLLSYALLAVIAFSVAPLKMAWTFGTLGIGFLALSLWCFVFTFLWIYLPKRLGIGNWAIAPLVLLFLVGQPAERALRTAPIDQQAPLALPTLQDHHASWRQALPDDQSPVFLVAAAGGGLRAAYWTGSLLAALDDRSCGAFGDRVFAVSGVSGGSIGLSAYLAQRKLWAAKPRAQRCATGRVAELQRFLRRDYLSPVAGSMLFAEVPQAFIPFTYLQHERGSTLADAMAQGWRESFPHGAADLLERPFLEVMASQPSPGLRMPAVYLNATTVESGRRAVAANVQLGAMRADPLFFAADGTHGTRLQTSGLSLIDASVNSARFPGISPPGRVMGCFAKAGRVAGTEATCREAGYGVWGHVVDGGFFENSGLETLMDAWRELIEPMAQQDPSRAAAERRRTHLIVISNDKATGSVCGGRDPSAPALQAAPVGGAADHAVGSDLMSPLHTLSSVRGARADLALQRAMDAMGCGQLIEWHLSSVMNGEGDRQRPEPPLGWMLSRRSAAVMDQGVQATVAGFAVVLPPVRR